MKVLLVIPALAVGGAEEQVRLLHGAFPEVTRNVCEILVVGPDAGLIDEKCSFKYLQFFYFNHSKIFNYLFVPFQLLRRRSFFKKFDVIHCNLTWGVWLGIWIKIFNSVKLFHNIKISMTIHFVYGKEKFFSKYVHKMGFFLFDGLVFVKEDNRFAIEYPQARGKVIHINNGVDFEDSLNCRGNFSKHELTVGILSRLSLERDVQKGILIFNNLSTLLPDLEMQLLIGGDGSNRVQLERFCSKLSSKDHIEFLGLVTDRNLFFKKIDLFITLTDGVYPGVSGLEAIARAIPTFGYTETNQTFSSKFLISSSNEMNMSLDIAKFIQSKLLLEEYRKEQYAFFSQEFSINDTVVRYLNFFENLCR